MRTHYLGILNLILSIVFAPSISLTAPALLQDGAISKGSVSIGKSTAAASNLILDVNSTSKAAKPAPDMTEAQRDAIPSPTAGMQVYNTDTNKLNVFDGVAWVEVGSGAGGTNGGVLTNHSFENSIPTQGWTLGSGVTCDADTTKFVDDGGKQSIKCSLSSTNGKIISQIYTANTGSLNFENTLYALTNQTGIVICAAVDGVDQSECQTVPNDQKWFKGLLTSITAATKTVEIYAKTTSSKTCTDCVNFDSAYLGPNRNLGTVRETSWLGSIKYAATTNCFWSRSGAGADSYGNFTADTDCATPTPGGSAAAPGTKIPALVFASIPAGRLVCTATGGFSKNGADDTAANFRFTDGTTATSNQIVYTGTSNPSVPTIMGEWTYTAAQSNVTIQIQGKVSNTSSAVIVAGHTADLEISCKHYPLASELAFRADTVNWRVDANISGGNPDLGTSAVASYTGLTNSSLTLTKNSGSIDVMIPCAGTTAPSGTTCSAANESVGVSFNIPRAGSVLACASFTHAMSNGAGAALRSTFQIVETPSNAQTISQEGKSRVASQMVTENVSAAFPHRLCGTFVFTSAGQKTLRLMYEQTVSGTVNTSVVAADADVSNGQRDIHWEVYPIDQAFPAPLITFPKAVMVKAVNIAGTTISTDAAIPFATEREDTHGAWSTDTFTAPYDALYEACFGLYTNGLSLAAGNNFVARVLNNGVEDGIWLKEGSGTTNNQSVTGCNTYRLSAGQTLKLNASFSTGSVALSTTAGRNYITIRRVGDYQ